MRNKILTGHAFDVLASLPGGSVHSVITSPPYWRLREYDTPPVAWGGEGQCDHQEVSGDRCQRCGAWFGHLGAERSPDQFVDHLVAIFDKLKRPLRLDGTLFVNLGDSFMGSTHLDAGGKRKAKDMAGIPWHFAFAMRDDGWYLRSAMPWVKRNSRPESAKDRPTTALEYVFMFAHPASKGRYFYDKEAVLVALAPATIERTNYHWVASDAKSASYQNMSGLNRDEQYNVDLSGRGLRDTELFFASLESPFGAIGTEEEVLALDVTTKGISESHFAAYPIELVKPLIRVSTSEYGCCAECGRPWKREVSICENPRRSITKRWKQMCDCSTDDVAPAVVLDPFLGSGTTAIAARLLGRDYIGIELNEEYAKIAESRIPKHVTKKLFVE